MVNLSRPIDSKQIIKRHRKTIEKLNNINSSVEQYRLKVKKASDVLVAQKVFEALLDMPIEEINRDKRGIRVKALRNYGYKTIADITTTSVYTIASIRGISQDTAYLIKEITSDIVSKTRQNIKIKLSADNPYKEATELVAALSQYHYIKQVSEKCQNLLKQNSQTIDFAVKNLKSATGMLRWFFSSKEKKEKACEAYDILFDLINGEYKNEAEKLIADFDTIAKSTDSEAWQNFTINSVAFFNDLEAINPGILGKGDDLYGLPEELAQEVQAESFLRKGLYCKLRRYQELGVKYALHQKRILLGDEMGLGKTVQAIATMVSLQNAGGTHFVVVCPTSLLTNWCREIEKKSFLKITKIYGPDREMALAAWIENGGVAVTTYETTAYFKLADNFKFKLLVVDEAHYIKNPEAQRSINVKKISAHAERLFFMTGTALENKVEEMISLIQILQPRIALKVREITFISAAPEFRKIIAPVYFRRKREDVLTELPELIENKEWCILSAQEEIAYEKALLGKNYAAVRRVSWNVENLKDSSKALRLLEIVEAAEYEKRKIIVFSFFKQTLETVKEFLGKRCIDKIDGSVTPQRRQEIIDEFDKAASGTVLVAQIQSGGTGLNIQSASVVVFCEPQFKPSIENQAISRAYRMGQTRNVLVYRLLCEGTVDEKMMTILENKQAIFDAFADKSVAAEEGLNIDERTFGNIIKDEIDRIKSKNINN